MFTVHLSDLFAPTVQSSVLNLDHRGPSACRRLATTPTTFSSRTTTSCRQLPPALTTGSPPPPSLHALCLQLEAPLRLSLPALAVLRRVLVTVAGFQRAFLQP